MKLRIPFACETHASMSFDCKVRGAEFKQEIIEAWDRIAQKKDVEYIFPLCHPNLILRMWHEENRLGYVFDRKKIRQICDSIDNGKSLRPEKKDAIIRVAIFLSRNINKKLLGVGYSVREMALLLDMTPQRVSKSIDWLSQQNFICLRLCKRGRLVVGSYIRIESLFWSSFTQDICKDELEEIFNGRPEGIETYYFEQLLFVESALRQLTRVTRSIQCDDEVKERAYCLLEETVVQQIRVRRPFRLPFVENEVDTTPPVGAVVQSMNKKKIGILVSHDEVIYFDKQLIKTSVAMFAQSEGLYSQRHLYVTCVGKVAYGLKYVAARANQLYSQANKGYEFRRSDDFVAYCLWQRRIASMSMGERLDSMLSNHFWIDRWRSWDITRKCIGSDDE